MFGRNLFSFFIFLVFCTSCNKNKVTDNQEVSVGTSSAGTGTGGSSDGDVSPEEGTSSAANSRDRFLKMVEKDSGFEKEQSNLKYLINKLEKILPEGDDESAIQIYEQKLYKRLSFDMLVFVHYHKSKNTYQEQTGDYVKSLSFYNNLFLKFFNSIKSFQDFKKFGMINLISGLCINGIIPSGLENKIKILFGFFEGFNNLPSSALTYKERLFQFVAVEQELLKKASDDEDVNNCLIHIQNEVKNFLTRGDDLPH